MKVYMHIYYCNIKQQIDSMNSIMHTILLIDYMLHIYEMVNYEISSEL